MQTTPEILPHIQLSCQICYGTLESPAELANCRHTFDVECFRDYIEFCLMQGQVLVKCPLFTCAELLNEADVKLYAPDLLEVFHKQTLLGYRNAGMLQQCYKPDCEFFFELTDEGNQFVCPKCYTGNCIACKSTEHYEMTCDEYKSYTVNDEIFFEAAEGFSYKQCPKCHFWVEKTQGCNHMTCRCSFQFCYVCGGVYKNCECNGHKNTSVFQKLNLFGLSPAVVKERTDCMRQWMKFTNHRAIKTLADFFFEEEEV